MPFERRGLHMFRDWRPDSRFDAENDRLLVTTSWHDTFVVCGGQEEDEGKTLVIDKEFMPENLAGIPKGLGLHRTLPLEWDASAYPWDIFLFDGEMSHDGPFIEMDPVGLGWTRSITSHITIMQIEPIHRADINPRRLSRVIDGILLGEYTVNINAIYDEALRIV